MSKCIIIKSRGAFQEKFIPPTVADRETDVPFLKSHLEPLTRGDIQPIGLHIIGSIGTGKTVTMQVLLENIQVQTIYVKMNMLGKAKVYQTFTQILEAFGLRAYGSIATIISRLKRFVGDKPFVVVLDETDACPSEALNKIINFLSRETSATIIVISRRPDVISKLEKNTIDAFKYQECIFKEYTVDELLEILKQRRELALYPNTCDDEVLTTIAQETVRTGSARLAIHFLAEAASLAEQYHSSKVALKFLKEARANMEKNSVKKIISFLPLEHQLTLDCLIRARQSQETLTVPQLYQQLQKELKKTRLEGIAMRTFYEILSDLKQKEFVKIKEWGKGFGRGFEYRIELTEIVISQLFPFHTNNFKNTPVS